MMTAILTLAFVALAVQPSAATKFAAVSLFIFQAMVLGGIATVPIIIVGIVCLFIRVGMIFV